jgi:hypothetical protein
LRDSNLLSFCDRKAALRDRLLLIRKNAIAFT